jgi:hypothetical protein
MIALDCIKKREHREGVDSSVVLSQVFSMILLQSSRYAILPDAALLSNKLHPCLQGASQPFGNGHDREYNHA